MITVGYGVCGYINERWQALFLPFSHIVTAYESEMITLNPFVSDLMM